MDDEEASCLKKGERKAVIEYRPQLERSENEFIGQLKVPEWNANDAPLLEEMMTGWEQSTETIPETVSTDDEFASEQ